MTHSSIDFEQFDFTLDNLSRLQGYARTLLLNSKRPVSSVIAGVHTSRFRGRGVDYLESRAYQIGDDIRNLDWRVTARTGDPYTKVFQEERERPVICVVDMTPSMYFATHGTLKVILAARMASLIGWAAIQRGDRIGGLIYSADSHQEIRPAGGRRGISRFIKTLHESTLANDPETYSLETSMRESMHRLRRVSRPGSLIIMFSDFLKLNDEMTRHLTQLRQHCDVVAFNIADHIEYELPPADQYRVSDGKRSGSINLSDRKHRARFQAYFKEKRESAESLCKRIGIHYSEVMTDQAPLDALFAVFARRTGSAA